MHKYLDANAYTQIATPTPAGGGVLITSESPTYTLPDPTGLYDPVTGETHYTVASSPSNLRASLFER